MVEQRLRAADGEGGHKNVPLECRCALHDAFEFLLDVVMTAAMLAIAVGALHDHHVDRARGPAFAVVAQDRGVGAP